MRTLFFYAAYCISLFQRVISLVRLILCHATMSPCKVSFSQSIKCYVSATRYGQIAAGFSDSFRVLYRPRSFKVIEYVLKEVKRQQVVQGIKPLKRLPIIPAILSKLLVLWQPAAAQADYDSVIHVCSGLLVV